MKKIILAAFILFGITAAGCNVQTNQPSTVPSLPTQNQNVTGLLTGVKAVPGGNSTITIQTANGTRTFSVAANTTLNLSGQACSITDLAAIQAGNTSLNCTVLYNEQLGVFGVYVTGNSSK